MRLLFTLAALVLIAVTLGTAPSHAQQGGATLPIPQPVPTLPGQSVNACMINCNTAAGNCQGSCQNVAIGTATNPQCFINCTAAQTVCQANCSTTTTTGR